MNIYEVFDAGSLLAGNTYPGRGKETLELVMDSDDRRYGGSTASPVKKIRVTDPGCTFELPAFSGRCYTQKKAE